MGPDLFWHRDHHNWEPTPTSVFEQEDFRAKLTDVLYVLSTPDDQLDFWYEKHGGRMDASQIWTLTDQGLVSKLGSFTNPEHIRHESTFVTLLCARIENRIKELSAPQG